MAICNNPIAVQTLFELESHQEVNLTTLYNQHTLLLRLALDTTPNSPLGYDRVIHLTLKVTGTAQPRQRFSLYNTTRDLYSLTFPGQTLLTAHSATFKDAGVYKTRAPVTTVWIAPGATLEFTPLVNAANEPYWVVSGPENPAFSQNAIYTTHIRKPLWLDYDPGEDTFAHVDDYLAFNKRLVVFKPAPENTPQPRFSLFSWAMSVPEYESSFNLSFNIYNNLTVPIQLDYGYMQSNIRHTTASDSTWATRTLAPGRTVEVSSMDWDVQVIGDTEVGND